MVSRRGSDSQQTKMNTPFRPDILATVSAKLYYGFLLTAVDMGLLRQLVQEETETGRWREQVQFFAHRAMNVFRAAATHQERKHALCQDALDVLGVLCEAESARAVVPRPFLMTTLTAYSNDLKREQDHEVMLERVRRIIYFFLIN